MVKAILLKPLDGREEGAEVEFFQIDFDRLKSLHAVRAAPISQPTPANKMQREPANKSKG